jgi:hypothetical protein
MGALCHKSLPSNIQVAVMDHEGDILRRLVYLGNQWVGFDTVIPPAKQVPNENPKVPNMSFHIFR